MKYDKESLWILDSYLGDVVQRGMWVINVHRDTFQQRYS